MPVSLSQCRWTVGIFLQTRGALDLESLTAEKCNGVNLV